VDEARLDALEDEFGAVEARLADPEVLADPTELRSLSKRHAELAPIVAAARERRAAAEDLETARGMLRDATGDDREVLREEIDTATATVTRLDDELSTLLLPKDPIVEIRGAEGGEEANLFAKDLFDMYAAYAGRSGWKLEVLSSSPSSMGGFDEVTFVVKGPDAWSHLKHEGGPHRVQRVPVTESAGRVHTSSATVTVLPEAEEVDVQIDPNDLRIDVYRSSGPGGQSVNTTDSAVRITHLPTGIVASCQNEKSQLQNREAALRILRARLLAAAQETADQEASDARRSQVRTVDRSERVRTYNYPENRIADHRVNYKSHNLDQVLDGDLDAVVQALVDADTEAKLAASAG
jgi:peptide chain release factor 1